MTELIALDYRPCGSWFSRLWQAIGLAFWNYRLRREEGFGSYSSWIEDVDRLARKEERA